MPADHQHRVDRRSRARQGRRREPAHSGQRTVADLVAERWPERVEPEAAASTTPSSEAPVRPEAHATVRPRTATSARRVERTVADLVAEAWPDGTAPVRPESTRAEKSAQAEKPTRAEEPTRSGAEHSGPPEPRKASALESLSETDSPPYLSRAKTKRPDQATKPSVTKPAVTKPATEPDSPDAAKPDSATADSATAAAPKHELSPPARSEAVALAEPTERRVERTVADLVAERWGAAALAGHSSSTATPTSPVKDPAPDVKSPAPDVEGPDTADPGTHENDHENDEDGESDQPAGLATHKAIPSLDAALTPRHNVLGGGLRSIGHHRLVDAALTKVNTGLRRPDGTRRTINPWVAGPGAAAALLVATLVAGIVSQSDGGDDAAVTGTNAVGQVPGAAQDDAPAPNRDKYASGRKTGDATPGALAMRGSEIGVPSGPIDCARPGRILDLDSWKLTLPVGAASKPTEIRGGRLGSYSTDFFKVGQTCNAVAFKAPVNGVTTSGSKNPRSELREMVGGGGGRAGWSSTSGTHTMVLTEAFTKLPDGKPQVVGGQIHDADDDISVFRLEGSNLYVTNGDDTHYQLVTSNYVLGTPFEAKYVVSGGVVRAFFNGQLVATINKSFSGAYFKAGAYTQANCDNASPCSSDNYGEVLVYALKVSHTP